MTPQEKAYKIISSFVILGFTLEASRQCALLSVNEIIEAMKKVEVRNLYNVYWHEVKQELNKL